QPANWFHTRVISQARNGQPAKAIAQAEKTFLRPGTGGRERYDLARVYAAAAAGPGLSAERKEGYAARAVALLGEAQAARSFNGPKQLAEAQREGDFDPLRDRPDFRKLFADPPAERGPNPRVLSAAKSPS